MVLSSERASQHMDFSEIIQLLVKTLLKLPWGGGGTL